MKHIIKINKKKIKTILQYNKIAIFGTGSHTKELLKNYPNINKKVVYFIDNKNCDKYFVGKKIICENDLSKYDFEKILISSKSFEKDIFGRLLGNGINGRKIITLYLRGEEKARIKREIWKYTIKDKFNINYSTYLKKGMRSKKFLIISPVPWFPGNIERMISVALRLKGHRVDEYICGGGFPSCGMEHDASPRPECNKCLMGAKHWFNLWSLPFKIIKLSKKDIEEAERIVKNMPFTEWKNWEYKGYPMGKRVYEHVYWYLSGDLSNEKKVKERVLKDGISYVLNIMKAEQIFNRNKYYAMIVANGKTIEGGPYIDVAKKNKIDFVTWEAIFTFGWNRYAHEFELDNIWETFKNKILDNKEIKKVKRVVSKLKYKSKDKTFQFYNKPIEKKEDIFRKLNITGNKKISVVFTNTVNDSAVIGKNKVFNDMFDWIFYIIEIAKEKKDTVFIFRAHPAEEVVKFPPQYLKIVDIIKNKYKKLPPNIKLIAPLSQMSSYSLLKLADVPFVYTGTLGLEAPFLGRKVVICGKAHYMNKGFTYDLTNKKQIEFYLSKSKEYFNINNKEKELAYKYAHLYFLGTRFEFPYMNLKKKKIINIKGVETFGELFWENMLDSLINKKEFLYLNRNREKFL